jgi:hypothetical protein
LPGLSQEPATAAAERSTLLAVLAPVLASVAAVVSAVKAS